jgi:4-amino-4-deoxy-L-arabinose transferase-like glycosyltransferase
MRVFLAALGLRLIPILLTRQLGIGLDDMFQYDMLARSLASGNGFRWYAPVDLARLAPYLHLDPSTLALDPHGLLTTFRAPLYPVFLAIIYFFNGINDNRFFAARLAQAVIGALLAPLTYWVAKSLTSAPLRLPPSRHGVMGGEKEGGRKERAAHIAAWMVAVYPMFLIFPLVLATENLFFLFVLASVFVLLKLAEHSQFPTPDSRLAIYYPLLSGFLLGLAALTRSVILPFAAFAILWIWFTLKQRQGAILAALALLLTIMPWIVRNSLLEHKLTPIETSMGYNLYVGYHPQSTGTFIFGPSLDLMSILDDKTRDEIGTQKAIQFIEQDPARFPVLATNRLGYFFDVEWRAFTYFYVNDFLGYIPAALLILVLIILSLPFMAISISAAYGSILLSWRPQTILLVLLFIGYLLPHVFILSEERFHLTLIPFFAILAAGFWTNGISALKSRGKVAMIVSSIIVLLLLVNWGFEFMRNGNIILQMFGPNGNQLYLPY